MHFTKRIIVTGGAGFIGSNFLRLMINKYPDYFFINIDALTYSGNIENIKDLEIKLNYKFIRENITNFEKMKEIIQEGDIIVNFAAESHVDNSIIDPQIFIRTNVLGTHSILEAARLKKAKLFIQISTDEVYGSLDFNTPKKTEKDVLNPSSPYSSSKAAADLICLGNIKTFNQPIIITRSSNNFGPFQFPEKVIPLFITNLINDIKVPLYGTGENIRDWLYVLDNCEAIDLIMHEGEIGQIYNIGGGTEISNLELTKLILKKIGRDELYIDYVKDRRGHDLKYSINCSKICSLGWKPRFKFEDALDRTIEWYKNNENWWKPLKKIKGRRTS